MKKTLNARDKKPSINNKTSNTKSNKNKMLYKNKKKTNEDEDDGKFEVVEQTDKNKV